MLHPEYYVQKAKWEQLVQLPNKPVSIYTGLFTRWENPVLRREHIPPFWKYDLNTETNPYFMERLGVNSTFNSGALRIGSKYYLIARIEGYDRKSFFGVAESDNPVQGFRFWDYPVQMPDTQPNEVDVYDMRLTEHEDGWIYGVFCSESKDAKDPGLSAAVAAAGIVRTKDLKTWERLHNLITQQSPQQRNVVLLPAFVQGKYAFYTRPMDGFINTGSGGGIGFGLCEDIAHAVIDHEVIVDARYFHGVTEEKNGAGIVPVKTEQGWLHIAHGVRCTAAGLRYVLYAFVTDLEEPWRVIAQPGGYMLAPYGDERSGDVDNVLFANGAVVDGETLYLYYASCDTRLHVASTTLPRILDYAFHTPQDARRSVQCVAQRSLLIRDNLAILARENEV